MNKLTDSEKLMYDVMGAIANSHVPVIFKGAMVTKLILNDHDFNDFTRETQDIDASWMGANPPSMEQLTVMLDRALLGFGLTAVVKREYGDKMSAGYKIVDAFGNEKLSIDIDMRPVVGSRRYRIGNVTFQGMTSDNVITDKINVAASDKIFRRSKDLIDLYALAHCVSVKTTDIRVIWECENRIVGTFDAFTNRMEELRHSYEKLRRIDVKPEFDIIYGYLMIFLDPFIKANNSALIWDRKTCRWLLQT